MKNKITGQGLALFAVLMAWESVDRVFFPVLIEFNEAILVAVVGLVVNAACVAIMGVHEHGKSGHGGHAHRHGDHNLRAAYFHVLADTLTSLLAE